jgi:hypothetical protein
MKPQVDIEVFASLDLRVGTTIEAHPLVAFPDLTAITVQIDGRIEALAPTSKAKGLSPGAQVVIATKLHPLTVGDARFTALLISPLTLGIAVPDGSRVS